MLRLWTGSAAQKLTRSCEASSSSFHTSTVRASGWTAESKQRNAALARRKNIERRKILETEAAANRTHPVLGTKLGRETQWDSSDLANVLITPAKLEQAAAAHVNATSTRRESFGAPPPVGMTTIRTELGPVPVPAALNYGISEQERELLFDVLPTESAKLEFLIRTPEEMQKAKTQDQMDEAERRELMKAAQLARIVDLRNASAQGIAYENRRRVVAAFSEPGKPDDTGRPEVQVALLTMKIRNLWSHMLEHKRDISQRHALRVLVHKRAKMLKYLRKTDRARYDVCLERLAIEPSAIEGEIVV